jgi:hypothetical protein
MRGKLDVFAEAASNGMGYQGIDWNVMNPAWSAPYTALRYQLRRRPHGCE